MIVNNIQDNHITGFKVTDNIVADKKVVGTFIKNTAELEIININHIYDNLKGQYIDIQSFGKWYVNDLETNEEFTESTLQLKDVTQKFDEDYEDIFPFPDTLKNWAIWIGNKVGVPLKGDFIKSNLILIERPYIGDNPKYRDAIKFIAKITGNYAQKNYDNTYSIKWFENTKIEIEDWEDFKHGSATKPTNVIVLSTGDTEENVKWPEQDPEEPHELRIEDDWINIDRFELNEAIYNQINGFFYIPISKLEVPFGLLNLRAGQKIKTKDIELQDIETFISSVSLEWQGGDFKDTNAWTTSIKMEELSETSTNLKYASGLLNKLLKVERKADKNAGLIEDTIESVNETSKNLEDLKEVIKEKEGNNHLCIEEAYETSALEYKVYGKCIQEEEATPTNPSIIKTIKGIKDIDNNHKENWLQIKVSNKEDIKNNNYKEKEVLVDLNKKSLFQYENKLLETNITADGTLASPTEGMNVHYVQVVPNKIYTVASDKERQWVLSFFNEVPAINGKGTPRTVINAKTYSFIVPEDYNYLLIREAPTINENNENIKVYEGYTSSYELNSIKEVKDELEIASGTLRKRIEKVILDGTIGTFSNPGNNNESFIQINVKIPNLEFQCSFAGDDFYCSHFSYYERALGNNKQKSGLRLHVDESYYVLVFSVPTTIATTVQGFKNWLKLNPITIYYQLKEEKTISLTPTTIPLFQNENHITLCEEVETNTHIKYSRDNALNEAFITRSENKAQLIIAKDEIKTELEGKYLTIEQGSQNNIELKNTITQQMNEKETSIQLELSKKLNDKDLTGAELLLRINGDESEAKIKADKLKLEGYTTINGNVEFTLDGKIKAVDGEFQGKIEATSGHIGGALIDANGIFQSIGTTGWGLFGANIFDNIAFYAGANTGNIGGAPLRIYHDGRLVCSNADISGHINATSGSFTGNITANTISCTNGTFAGWDVSSGGLSGDRLSLNSANGQISVFPVSGGGYIISNGLRLSATAGVAISSNSTGNVGAPSKNLDLKGCGGASVYIGCMTNAAGTTEASCLSVERGAVYMRGGTFYTNGVAVGASSSKNMKTNIQSISEEEKEEFYEIIKRIPLYHYDYKENYINGLKDNFGFIIEDIEKTIFSRAIHVIQDEKDENVKYYSGEDLARVLLIVTQSLIKKLEKLESRI